MNEEEIALLIKSMRDTHGFRFDELLDRSKQLATHIKRLDDFHLVEPDPLMDIPHVGRVIVDAVLQVGHDYEKQVRKRVEKIIQYDEAATVSGFLRLLKEQGINRLLGWNSPGMEKDLIAVGIFFANHGVETYAELKEWPRPEGNRDSLLSERSGLGGHGAFRIADKTADYFRVLVFHWDAVAVDSNIRTIFKNAAVPSGYSYKEMRTIFQLAALNMGVRPIDLDASIYNDSVVHPKRYASIKKRTRCRTIRKQSCGKDITKGGPTMNGAMPKKGDIFEGKINDLSLWDADGWRRRDITFFKLEIRRRENFEYPTRNDRIVLIDTAGDRYELNFSKPETEDSVCLGTPSRLKPWYRKKGFNERFVGSNEKVYFEYTGDRNEFIILTEQEYRTIMLR
jgi:hypothetical protein